MKTPAQGDYRVQAKFGGQTKAIEVASSVIEQGRSILTQIPFDEAPLYARVDGILRGGQFMLMELELIEPYLFLEFGDRGGGGPLARFLHLIVLTINTVTTRITDPLS
ncbi:MAG: hypothetical protein IPP40_16685 [bacterium]|nr:hypothetical protein [bacterium]